MKHKVLELFCGTKSFSNVAREMGCEVFTVDIDPQFNPDLCKDVRDLKVEDIPFKPNIIWASPPCDCFSVASIGKHWNKDGTPKTAQAKESLSIINSTLLLIAKLKPQYFFIENPRGMLRKMIDYFLVGANINAKRQTVTYCQYGEERMKPTDIWHNSKWIGKPACKNGNSCHTPAPRGSRTGTQGLKNKTLRAIVPKELCLEILTSNET